MADKANNNLENIKVQIVLLKRLIESMGKTLDEQEEELNLLHEKTKELAKEALMPSYASSTEEIMKKVFSKGRIPKILYKR